MESDRPVPLIEQALELLRTLTSAKSVKRIVERPLFLRKLELPAIPATLHQNRVLQLARKCSKYQTQPLLKFKPERRYALLVAHLFELSQDLTDQALDQFDKLLTELMRKGERRQEKHFEQLEQKNQTRLALTGAAEMYLETIQQEITEKIKALEESVGKVEGNLCLDDKGKLYLPSLRCWSQSHTHNP